MTQENIKLIILVVSVLVLLISVRRGIRCGVTGEISTFVSVVIATLCLVLILMLKRSMQNHSYATVIVVGGALVIIGTGWKLIRLIISPLKGFKKLGLVRTVDSILGAVAGVVEGGAFYWIAMKLYELYVSSSL